MSIVYNQFPIVKLVSGDRFQLAAKDAAGNVFIRPDIYTYVSCLGGVHRYQTETGFVMLLREDIFVFKLVEVNWSKLWKNYKSKTWRHHNKN